MSDKLNTTGRVISLSVIFINNIVSLLLILLHNPFTYDIIILLNFEKAFKSAECQPHNSVMVGDRLDNDIRPVKALGMKTVWIGMVYQYIRILI